ncbi:RBBP9/YdeN family alpha/beta hydrolase [Pseudonocardia spinosispora]|uniref:RBBP9/YdeN family alpha/beta hydrolase n=1 Tax=Pseudonocardia spinosispora TaxID=103441 RepID=UPI00041F11D0|nr:alpha/beta hydrolase [Pseudonocardia spinosispora]
MDFVLVPGIDGSDERHWQSRWEAAWGHRATRIAPASWTAPDLEDWSNAITRACARSGPDTVLVAHSLGCLAVAHWLSRHADDTRGAFLVAPPDRHGAAFPRDAAPSFLVVAALPLGTPSLVVASDDDPYCASPSSRDLARRWGAPRVSVGAQGHLSSDSQLDSWDHGWNLLTAFVAGLGGHPGTDSES